MSAAERQLPGFDELYTRTAALAEGEAGEILEPGVLRTMSRPGRAHRLAAKRIGADLAAFDRALAGSGWWIESEAEVRLLDDYLVVPDLAGWRVDRVPALPEANPIPLAPDWVCEILSPPTARDDRGLKLPLYARAGVGWIWLVDPDAAQVEVYETVAARATLAVTAREVASLAPFDHEIDIAAWFRPPT